MRRNSCISGKMNGLLAVAAAGAIAATLAASGCGGGVSANSSTQPASPTIATVSKASTMAAVSTTAASPDSSTSGEQPDQGQPNATQPQPEPAQATEVFEITDRQVSPEVVAPGAAITFSAWVKGDASTVTMKVIGQNGTSVTVPLAFLVEAGSGIYRWSATTAAPMEKGLHRYYASAVSTSGTTAEMPGVSAYSFCVGDPAADCG